MTEYHTVKRIDNSRLVRPSPTAQLQGFRRRLLTCTAMAACLLCYAWQHFECIQTAYQLEELNTARAQATELNQQLQLEVATLRSPMRVDSIARTQLGLTVPAPGQVAPVDAASDGVLADARPAALSTRP
jgi:cell division protein FtsL